MNLPFDLHIQGLNSMVFLLRNSKYVVTLFYTYVHISLVYSLKTVAYLSTAVQSLCCTIGNCTVDMSSK